MSEPKHGPRHDIFLTVVEVEAYDAGYDAGTNGPNMTNCHFTHFGDARTTRAWECGKADGDAEKDEQPGRGECTTTVRNRQKLHRED